MSKSKRNILLVAAAVILVLFVVAGVTGGASGTVKCPDCAGEGVVDCPDCSGYGKCDTCDKDRVVSCETCSGEGRVRGTLWALLPPIIAIGLALITKEVYSSLFIGILSGALLYSNFSFAGTLDSAVGTGLIDAVSGNAGIFIFLVELGIIVALINKAGGSYAFGN